MIVSMIVSTYQGVYCNRENFSVLSQEEKCRSVAKNLEQLIDEVG